MSNKNPKSTNGIGHKSGTREFMQRTHVNDMAFTVDHYIPVMPVLDLQYVTCNRICRHGLDEVQPGLLESYSMFPAISRHKEIHQVVNLCTTHLIS
jgi:hypothetical protein